MYLAHLKSF